MEGLAKVTTSVNDASLAANRGLGGTIAVAGITERGALATPILVSSWPEYRRHFGELVSYSDFPLYCKRALDRGGVLLISRVAHYTDVTDKSTVVGTVATGNLTLSSDTVEITAASIGSWANSVTVTTQATANSVADELDIIVSIAGFPELTQTVRNVPKDGSTLTALNGALTLVSFGTVATVIPVATVTLTSGAEDYSGLVAADYSGNQDQGLGVYAFDSHKNITKMCFMESTDNVVEVALLAYAAMRKDLRVVLRCPVGLTGLEAIAFRQKTDAYSGDTALDSWYGDLVYGDLTIVDPRTETRRDISAIGDVVGIMSSKDKPWLAAAGVEAGTIYNNLGVVYNVNTPARAIEGDSVDAHGVNPVIEVDNVGAVYWGNSTLQRADTLLAQSNVADLVAYLIRTIKPLVQPFLFLPNDLETWRAIYRQVDSLMAFIEAERGVHGYVYQGDQDIDEIEEAVINTAETIANGEYNFNLFIKPIGALKYTQLNITVNKTGVDYEILTNQAVI